MIGVECDELSQNVHTLVTNPQKEIMFKSSFPLIRAFALPGD